ncbi:hypothetical protein JXO59_07300 [candidate division KSB1 bacterium]|nr:hypothetical protein [candidate division KSB1 bacterium]
MICEHLASLEKAIIDSGAHETYRSSPWTKNCREWVYYDVVLDIDSIQERFDLPDCVQVHENMDPKSGMEKGFYCSQCHDAVMGLVEGGAIFG